MAGTLAHDVAPPSGRDVPEARPESDLLARQVLGKDRRSAVSADKADKTFCAKAPEVLLEHVAEKRWQVSDAVGLGRDVRFEARHVFVKPSWLRIACCT